MLYLASFFNCWGKTHFLQLLSYFNSFVYLRFKYGRPQILIFSKYLFQNKNLCWWCVPRRDILFCLFTCPGSNNVICCHFEPDFLEDVDILTDFASNILPELFKPEGLLSNLEYLSESQETNSTNRAN